jgi:hypothetical protein
MSEQSFNLRHLSMIKCIEYPVKFRPYKTLNGFICHFTKNVGGLSAFSAPKDVMAIFVSNTASQTPNEFSTDKLDQHGYFWPMPDGAYAQFLLPDYTPPEEEDDSDADIHYALQRMEDRGW